MSFPTIRGLARRYAPVVAAAAGALALTAAAALAEPSPSPGVLPGEPNPPWDDGATPAVPDATLVNARPVHWDHILVAPDGRTLDVYYTAGALACHGLARIDVAPPSSRGVRVIVYVGDVAAAPSCGDEQSLYRATVVLDAPVLSGGSQLDLPSG